jgi:hypothetical protein
MPKAAKKVAPPVEETAGDLAHDPSTNAPPDVRFDGMLEDLELEASNWLDDEPLASQDQADQLAALVDVAAKLVDEIEGTRKVEKQPFLEAGKAVDQKYNPLKERGEKTLRKLKNKIGDWLRLVAAEKARKEREADEERRAAERRLLEEQERNRRSSTLADDEALREAEAEVERTRIEAAKAKKEPVVAAGGNTNVKLRKVWLVNIVDRKELLVHYLKLSAAGHSDFADDLQELLYKHARADVRSHVRSLPGCRIWAEDKAV